MPNSNQENQYKKKQLKLMAASSLCLLITSGLLIYNKNKYLPIIFVSSFASAFVTSMHAVKALSVDNEDESSHKTAQKSFASACSVVAFGFLLATRNEVVPVGLSLASFGIISKHLYNGTSCDTSSCNLTRASNHNSGVEMVVVQATPTSTPTRTPTPTPTRRAMKASVAGGSDVSLEYSASSAPTLPPAFNPSFNSSFRPIPKGGVFAAEASAPPSYLDPNGTENPRMQKSKSSPIIKASIYK